MRMLRILLAVLLLASAAVFASGVAVERSKGHHDAAAASGDIASSPEGSPEHEAQEGRMGAGAETSETETFFGIRTESNGVVAAVVVVSVILAAAAVFAPKPALLLVALVGMGAVGFDSHEITRQIRESCETVLALASTTAGLHLLLASAALIAVARTSEMMRGIIPGRGPRLPRR